MESELEKLYLTRPIEEEDYSFEQWAKIKELREQSSKKENNTNWKVLYRDVAKVGDPVYFNNETIRRQAGYLVKINNQTNRWKMSGDISTALGVFKDIIMGKIWFREIKDMSDVVIPQELKTISTERLLNAYKSVIRTWSDIHINGCDYTKAEVKAELSIREHIFSGEDKKLMKKMK